LILAFLLALQITAVDSVYASRAVRHAVERASLLNRQVPSRLAGYTASAESEISLVARRAEGNEGAISVEQTLNTLSWDRSGAFEQHVVGYRTQSIGLQFSTLSFFRQAWTVPVLYGNRLALLFGRDSSVAARQRRQQQPTLAVHPLAADRERVYRFGGGDTVVTLRVDGREIPIVRVQVEPRDDISPGTVAFHGELDLDASRHALVRMRGSFVRRTPPPPLLLRVATLGGLDVVAFVELENIEVEGRYWLPGYQRFEVQAALASGSEARSIFRIVTRIRDHRISERDIADSLVIAPGDSLRPQHYTLSMAPTDSMARSTGWRRELGSATSAVHSDDFNDIGPDAWRTSGRPRFSWRTQRVMDVVRFNRVEGLYTGYGAEWRFRDAAPGLTLRGNAGWAWSEGTARGRAAVEWRRGRTTYLARAGRSLDITNDFRSVFDSGSTVGALFGVDNYDYVDRRIGALGVWRQLGKGRVALLRLETGPAADRFVSRNVSRGLVRGDSGFLEVRGVRPGDYWRHWASLEWRPDVSADFVGSGLGGWLSAEVAQGDLAYTRLEGRVVARRNLGPFSVAARGDAGMLLGNAPPPQQLFELGKQQNLPGYDYKEFAGTHAAMARGLAMYRLPMWRTPIRVGRLFLPPAAPALSMGVQSGWTEVRGDGGSRALRELGVQDVFADDSLPTISRPTDGVRTTITIGLRLFGGAMGVGIARAVDRPAAWRLVIDFSQGM